MPPMPLLMLFDAESYGQVLDQTAIKPTSFAEEMMQDVQCRYE